MSSGSTIVELQPIAPEAALTKPSKTSLSYHEPKQEDHRLSDLNLQPDDPENAVEALAQWNKPRENIYRLASIFFAFINFGMNDASYGPLLPYVQRALHDVRNTLTKNPHQIQTDYGINYTVASLVFLSPFAGYIVASLVADRLHLLLGKRGVAFTSPLCRIIAYITIPSGLRQRAPRNMEPVGFRLRQSLRASRINARLLWGGRSYCPHNRYEYDYKVWVGVVAVLLRDDGVDGRGGCVEHVDVLG